MNENQNNTPSSFNLDDFSKKSEAVYRKIQIELESKYKGKFVAIDSESEKYWIGDTATEALSKAKKEFPTKLFYLIQVGSPATFSIQSTIRRTGSTQKFYGPKWSY